MASELRVDTLKDSSGNNSVGMSYVANGTAKAWAFVDGTGTVAVRDSHNTASVTDNSTGNYTVSWTNSMSSADYAASLTTSDSANGNDRWMTANYPHATGSLRGNSRNSGATAYDSDGHSYIATGDLA